MRKNIVAGNWKMNKNLQEGIALAKELNEALAADKPNCDVESVLRLFTWLLLLLLLTRL